MIGVGMFGVGALYYGFMNSGKTDHKSYDLFTSTARTPTCDVYYRVSLSP